MYNSPKSKSMKMYSWSMQQNTWRTHTHTLLFAQLSGAVFFFECVRQCVQSACRAEACYETFHDRVVNSLLHHVVSTGTWIEQFFCDHVWQYAPKRNMCWIQAAPIFIFFEVGTGRCIHDTHHSSNGIYTRYVLIFWFDKKYSSVFNK